MRIHDPRGLADPAGLLAMMAQQRERMAQPVPQGQTRKHAPIDAKQTARRTPAPAAVPLAVPLALVQVATAKITDNSAFDIALRVTIDPYGLNPLEQDARQNFRTIRMRGVAPKMFMGGTEDLPLFTATGLEPRMLLKLPYKVRHYAAAETSLAAVHGLFERYADLPYAHLAHEGLDAAIERVRFWVFNQGGASS